MVYKENVKYAPIFLEGNLTKYLVSNDGHVYNGETGKELSPDITYAGYLRVLIYYKGYRKAKSIHRLVATAFIPNPDNLPEVNHKDGNKTNNDVSNLEWCTGLYNVRHSYEHHLNHSGEDHRFATLSNNAVLKVIRCLNDNKLCLREIAKLVGTSRKVIAHIKSKDCWKSFTKDCDFSHYDVFDGLFLYLSHNKEELHTVMRKRAKELMVDTSLDYSDISKITDIPIEEMDDIRKHVPYEHVYCKNPAQHKSQIH